MAPARGVKRIGEVYGCSVDLQRVAALDRDLARPAQRGRALLDLAQGDERRSQDVQGDSQ